MHKLELIINSIIRHNKHDYITSLSDSQLLDNMTRDRKIQPIKANHYIKINKFRVYIESIDKLSKQFQKDLIVPQYVYIRPTHTHTYETPIIIKQDLNVRYSCINSIIEFTTTWVQGHKLYYNIFSSSEFIPFIEKQFPKYLDELELTLFNTI